MIIGPTPAAFSKPGATAAFWRWPPACGRGCRRRLPASAPACTATWGYRAPGADRAGARCLARRGGDHPPRRARRPGRHRGRELRRHERRAAPARGGRTAGAHRPRPDPATRLVVIRIATPVQRLRADERFGLEVLIDLTRLLPVDDPAADVVRLELDDTPGAGEDLRAFLAGRVPVATGEGELRLPRWTLRHVTAVAGAEVEQRSPERDRFDRVPAAANPLVEARRERHPVVSQLACDLRAAALRAAGRRAVRCLPPWPDAHRWAVALTHDLDVVTGWPAFSALRVLELVGKGKLGLAARAFGAALGALGRDPVWTGVEQILGADNGAPATWFVLAGTPSWETWRRGDVTYSLESRPARRILEAVRAAGHEIGLHGSYTTMLDAGRFRAERERLARSTGTPLQGVRQHFLRMRPGGTQHAMRAGGFEYDATYGFADRNGFRLGVADVVPGWEAARPASGPRRSRSAGRARRADRGLVPVAPRPRGRGREAGRGGPWLGTARGGSRREPSRSE